jgi:hypothetical protein
MVVHLTFRRGFDVARFSPYVDQLAEDSAEGTPGSLSGFGKFRASDTSLRLLREADLVYSGVSKAVVDTVNNPGAKLTELATSAGIGVTLGVANRLGTPGRIVTGVIGTAMLSKVAYDELTGNRWTMLAGAVKDTWNTPLNKARNEAIVADSLGNFLVDTGIGYASKGISSALTSRFASPRLLVKDAVARAETDGGRAMLKLQDRYEAPFLRSRHNKTLAYFAHTEPAVPGGPRGDLIRVMPVSDRQFFFASMDVEGHGAKAAKKALAVHAVIDKELLKNAGKAPNDILGIIDSKLSSVDDLSVTASLSKYNSRTGELTTASASSQLAYVVRNDGSVQRLINNEPGLALGVDLYKMMPAENHITRLNRGDTVVMASDGVFDRFAYGDISAFEKFLARMGPNPKKIRKGILSAPPAEFEADDTSFIVFQHTGE